MKLLVFSDSHGAPSSLLKAVQMHRGKCDAIIFTGDGLRDLSVLEEKYPEIPIFKVKGNCDLGAFDAESELVLNFDGIKILIIHGHNHGAKYGYERILYYAREIEADAVLFGHTHVPYDCIYEIDGKKIHLFNPGSIATERTFGVVNTANGILVTNVAKIY